MKLFETYVRIVAAYLAARAAHPGLGTGHDEWVGDYNYFDYILRSEVFPGMLAHGGVPVNDVTLRDPELIGVVYNGREYHALFARGLNSEYIDRVIRPLAKDLGIYEGGQYRENPEAELLIGSFIDDTRDIAVSEVNADIDLSKMLDKLLKALVEEHGRQGAKDWIMTRTGMSEKQVDALLKETEADHDFEG